MFTYSGWNAAAYVAEEIRDPGRNVPRALALGTGAVIAIYLLLNALYLYVLPVGELAAIKGSVLDVIADRLLGAAAGNIMGVVSIVSLLASISAMTFAGPRVYFAMARDGLFFTRAARVHPRYRTPAVAIVAQAVWSSLLVLSATGRRARQLHRLCDRAVLGGGGGGAVRAAREAAPERRASVPRVGLSGGARRSTRSSSVAILVNGLYRAPGPTGAGALIIAAGIPLYLLFRRGTSGQSSNPESCRSRRACQWLRIWLRARRQQRPAIVDLLARDRSGRRTSSVSNPGATIWMWYGPASSFSAWNMPSKSSTSPAKYPSTKTCAWRGETCSRSSPTSNTP